MDFKTYESNCLVIELHCRLSEIKPSSLFFNQKKKLCRSSFEGDFLELCVHLYTYSNLYVVIGGIWFIWWRGITYVLRVVLFMYCHSTEIVELSMSQLY